MNIRPLLFILTLSFLSACSTSDTSIAVDTTGSNAIASAVRENKAVILVDVHHDGKVCRGGSIQFGTIDNYFGRWVSAYPEGNFANSINDTFAALKLSNNYAITNPGGYLVKVVKCENTTLAVNSLFGLPTESYKRKVQTISPRFKVEPGQILHIGTINIVTLKKGGWLTDGRGIAVRQRTSDRTRNDLRKRFPSLISRIQFTD